MESES